MIDRNEKVTRSAGKVKIALAVGLIAAVGAVGIAGTSYANKWREGHGYHQMFGGEHGGRHGGHRGGFRHVMKMFDEMDVNQDGSLTQQEIDNSRSERLAAFDSNSDGQLTIEEYEALWIDAMRERMVDRFQDLDADGDSVVTAAEFGEPFSKVVRFMDRNGDGAISVEDRPRRGHRDQDDD